MSRRYTRHQADDAIAEEEGGGSAPSWGSVIRRGIGVLAVLALILIAIYTERQVNDAGADQTVVQQIGYYAQGAFYAVTAVGVAVTVYIITRPDD